MGVQLPGHKPLLAHEVDGDEFVLARGRLSILSVDTVTIERAPTLRSRRIPAATAAKRRKEVRENAGVFYRILYVRNFSPPTEYLEENPRFTDPFEFHNHRNFATITDRSIRERFKLRSRSSP